MDTNLMQLWEKTLTIIKGEMSEVSFNTWIKSCKPLSIDDNTIKISVPNSFTQDILEKRYKDFENYFLMHFQQHPTHRLLYKHYALTLQ